MTRLSNSVRARVQDPLSIDVPYIATFNEVRRGYGESQWKWWVMLFAIMIIATYYVITKGFTLLTLLVLVVGVYGGFFIPAYFFRASDAMGLGQVSGRHIQRCIDFLKQYDQKQLKKIKRMAETDRESVQYNTTLTNVFWPLVLVFGATVYNLPKDFMVPWVAFPAALIFVTIPLMSFLVQTERANADLVMIQAITQLEEEI